MGPGPVFNVIDICSAFIHATSAPTIVIASPERAKQSHRKKLSLRGAQKIPHVVRNRLRNLIGTGVVATLPSVARNDILSLTLGLLLLTLG